MCLAVCVRAYARVRAYVWVCVNTCFIQFVLGSCYSVHINALSIYYESVHRKEQHASGINTIP